MITSNNIITSIFKNLVKNGDVEFNNNSLKLPDHFTAMVKKIQNEFALIEWKGRIIPVKIEVPVSEGELLLLQLKKKTRINSSIESWPDHLQK
ncbi:MAG: hypothetical protein CVU88_00025 [Firmicutes bacterium HGW-Firmicutes-13]|nr:MAG: hypothetical protein CVU88_00025 [Firmicutes bacterium HGW-Firmicutes-13]